MLWIALINFRAINKQSLVYIIFIIYTNGYAKIAMGSKSGITRNGLDDTPDERRNPPL